MMGFVIPEGHHYLPYASIWASGTPAYRSSTRHLQEHDKQTAVSRVLKAMSVLRWMPAISDGSSGNARTSRASFGGLPATEVADPLFRFCHPLRHTGSFH